MRDLIEMASEASQKAKGNEILMRELFTAEFIKELTEAKSEDIAPHLSVNFNAIKQEYTIALVLPACFCKMDSLRSNVK